LIGVEDLWLAAALQRHLKGIQTELRVKAVGEFPAEHIPGEEIHDRHQVEKAFIKCSATMKLAGRRQARWPVR
jgi:hypothetical protein